MHSITIRNRQDVIYELIYSLNSSSSQIIKLNHTFYLGIQIGNTYIFLFLTICIFIVILMIFSRLLFVSLTVEQNVYLILLILILYFC